MTNINLDELKRDCFKHICDIEEGDVEFATYHIIDYLASQNRIVADGWVAVPIEPTVAMNAEGSCVPCGIGGSPPSVNLIYKAMINAAQKGKNNES